MKLEGYLSNQWGFSETGRILVKQVKSTIENIGIHILDPFEECEKHLDFKKLEMLTSYEDKRKFWEDFSRKVTPINNDLMKRAHCQFAMLDGGPAVDDGVGSEIGYYAALVETGNIPKGYDGFGQIFALRTDVRCGENIGCIVNPQIEGYISQTGGSISRSLDKYFNRIEQWRKAIKIAD